MDVNSNTIALIPEGVDVSSYMLHSPMEIGHALLALAKKHDLTCVYVDHGKTSFISTIVDVNLKEGHFWFDVSGAERVNQAVTSADRVVFAAAPEGVKIQFVVRGNVSKVTLDSGPAFKAPFPPDMIKLQRREFFRLETPVGKPILCQMLHPDGRMVDMSLHDISIGGLGGWLPQGVHAEVLDHFKDCRLDLGTMGLITVTLEVRSARKVTQRNGNVQVLAGFKFVDLPRNVENILQRFIATLERERHQLLKK
ncbi:flagellar brake protein [Burkholderiaceae bacterium DAT-1]|nr:flagellar brake protein [Burkholderiaceae bacterium DAT-1]